MDPGGVYSSKSTLVFPKVYTYALILSNQLIITQIYFRVEFWGNFNSLSRYAYKQANL